MKNILCSFQFERFYHVFNRTNNKEMLFRTDENKRYFMSLVKKRLLGFVKFYSFALLGNHFHFAISICEEDHILKHISAKPRGSRSQIELKFSNSPKENRNIHELISHQWSRVFNSYAQAYNKSYKRNGHLFHSPFKRSEINYETQFQYLIYYIHHNSRKHNLTKNFLEDSWHSYHALTDFNHTFLEKAFVTNSFGARCQFMKFHEQEHLISKIKTIMIE